MRIILLQVALLAATVPVAFGVGYWPAQRWWGADGLASFRPAAVICLSAAVAAAVPLGITAIWRPAYVAQAALGGTVIRLLLTAGVALAYQTNVEVHLRSFLWWLTVQYMALLSTETAFSVLLMRRQYPPRGKETRSS